MNLNPSIYMRLNTMLGGEQLSERGKAALAKLHDDYAPFNSELTTFFGRRDLPWCEDCHPGTARKAAAFCTNPPWRDCRPGHFLTMVAMHEPS